MGLAFGSPIFLHTQPEQQDQSFGLGTRASPQKKVRRFPREDSDIFNVCGHPRTPRSDRLLF